jgi:hypothetical protein
MVGVGRIQVGRQAAEIVMIAQRLRQLAGYAHKAAFIHMQL